ncbi:MAG: helix-turn-helix transcriptional regulator [Paenibacillaceae bacterium]|nr:helix-turn-helix transcriptional regulator [Paenibacillaceae bacterium]
MYQDKVEIDGELFMKLSVSHYEAHETHMHDLLELCIILENKALYRFEDQAYEGLPGDTFLCRPFEPHWIFSAERERPCRYLLVYFQPSAIKGVPAGYKLLAPFYAAGTLPARVPQHLPHAQAIWRAARAAASELESPRQTKEARQFMHLIDMLTHLYEYAWEEGAIAGEVDSGIIEAIGCLIWHFADDAGIKTAIERSGLGRTQFYRRFRAVTGLTPHQFTNRLRLQLAAQLLLNEPLPIIRIAMECGFNSLSAFNKQFAARYGQPPRAYRKSAAAGRRGVAVAPGSSATT